MQPAAPASPGVPTPAAPGCLSASASAGMSQAPMSAPAIGKAALADEARASAAAAAAAAGDASAFASAAEHAWAVLRHVPDPEVPVLSVVDLGIVREVRELGDGAARQGMAVVVTPTYSGCPATEVIERSIVDALVAAGLGPVQVEMRRSPAWTTDWIGADARERLRGYGIAPPGARGLREAGEALQAVPIGIRPRLAPVACPRCASSHTERLSAFGATACKSLWRCLDCREPFEHFKPI